MDAKDSDREADLQRQIDAMSDRVTGNRTDIDELEHRADVSADEAAATRDRADAEHKRVDQLEADVAIDREMIAELQADGVLSREHAEQMEQALRSSREIGAAIGILMASRQLSQDEAFAALKQVSRQSNRKLRDIARDLVRAQKHSASTLQ